MLGRNETPFAAIAFQQLHRSGSDMAVIAVRGTFILEGELRPGSDQAIILVDEYAGDPQTTPLLRAADLIPFKPAADVTVLAQSYPPPDADPKKGWLAGVRVNETRYAVRVHGNREWAKKNGILTAGFAEQLSPVPVDYRNSWGDLAPGETPGDPPPFNPLGIRRPNTADRAFPMARIELPEEDLSQPNAVRSFQGFGPIPPFWRDRQQFAGTYDEHWLKERSPQLPADFDYRFYQCAHPRLIAGGFLRGDETIELFRLTPVQSVVFDLPGIQPLARFHWNDDRLVTMKLNLDGVHIDAREAPIRVDLTWRGWLPICPNFFCIDLNCFSLQEADRLDVPFSSIDGLENVNESGEVSA